MPVLDGLETCRRLKADPRTAKIPVVFLTARLAEVDEIVAWSLARTTTSGSRSALVRSWRV